MIQKVPVDFRGFQDSFSEFLGVCNPRSVEELQTVQKDFRIHKVSMRFREFQIPSQGFRSASRGFKKVLRGDSEESSEL